MLWRKWATALIVIVFTSQTALAWNANIHRVIAIIAYDNLTTTAKKNIDQITESLDPYYPSQSRFTYAATWPDQIKYDDVNMFNNWHFIDYPYSPDGTATKPPQTQNVVWAITESEKALTNSHTSVEQKAVFLRFLLHFTGDAHQPLHCINRYTKHFPNGDRGGNLVQLKNNKAGNLHRYWDSGLGQFKGPTQKVAQQIMLRYPPQFFGNKIHDTMPEHWTRESLQIAVDFAYNNNNVKNHALAAQQVALAGYRLANLLNQIYKGEGGFGKNSSLK